MRIALLGDTALFGKFALEENPTVLDYFEDVIRYLSGFDAVVANLETPFVGDAPTQGAKSAYIKSLPRNAAILKALNVSAVGLANNHLFDYGLDGYRATLGTLSRNGIDWFGVEGKQLVLPGPRVAFHGYVSYNTNPLGVASGGGPGVNPLNVRRVESQLAENHERGLLNVVSIHSGVEHVHFPSRDDIALARKLATICPYVYYGHHPHVVQGVEVLDGSLVAYSVGNFCFDDVYTDKSPLPLVKQSRENRTGLIVELEVDDGKLRGHNLTSVFAGDDRMVVGDAVGEEAVRQYSAALQMPAQEYEAMRRECIRAFCASRRRNRDLQWFLKRLNLRTIEMVVRARLNGRAYRKNVSELL